MKYCFASIFIILLLASCKDQPVSDAALPTNLQFTAVESSETDGLVEVVATADNANFFTVTFEDGSDSKEIESADGKAAYQYSASGTYKVIVRAHVLYDKYTEASKQVEVYLESDNTPIITGIPTSGYTTPESYSGYTLIWREEFNGNTLNEADWNYEIGTGAGGWGNNELQYYLKENATVQDGYLIIEAKEQLYNGRNYTSSRLTTQGKHSFKYGRIDIRAAIPYGQGMWPALWMLGDNISTVGWPKCGEIDIMELVGGNVTGGGDDYIHGTIHWDNNGSHASYGGKNKLNSGIYAEEFHVFSIIWDETQIRFLRDDIQYHVADITPSGLSAFHENFFFILNIAVGGNWPGSPDETTIFPQRMAVDYIRVFQ